MEAPVNSSLELVFSVRIDVLLLLINGCFMLDVEGEDSIASIEKLLW